MSTTTEPSRGFPWATWQQLSGIDLRLLDELIYLSKQHAKRSTRQAHYCTPGRKYLARKLACSVVTVSRHISKLKRLGILEAFQRRPLAGTWQTNFYQVRSWSAWKFGQIRQLISSVAHRVSKPTHIAFAIAKKIQPEEPNVAFGTLFDRWMLRGRAPAPA